MSDSIQTTRDRIPDTCPECGEEPAAIVDTSDPRVVTTTEVDGTVHEMRGRDVDPRLASMRLRYIHG